MALHSLFIMEQKFYISVDFDGTCVTANFPFIGYNIGAQYVLKTLVDKGHKIILNTLRGHVSRDWNKNNFDFDVLDAALNWFKANNIELYGVNENPDQDWTDSPKPFAHFIIDDYALGCPLINVGDRYFVDWIKITQFFYNCGVFDKEEVYYLNSHILRDQENAKQLLRINRVNTY